MEVFIEAIFFRDEMDRKEREKKAWAAIYGKKVENYQMMLNFNWISSIWPVRCISKY